MIGVVPKKLIKSFLVFMSAVFLLLVPAGAFPVSADASIVEVKITPEYKQTVARSQLSLLNSWRAGSNWYYKDSSNTKVYIQPLKALKYDYTLEKYAMQRAAEIAVSFDHLRPKGDKKHGLSGYAVGENIFASTRPDAATAQYAFTQWKEEDKPYASQGHRRNMLSVPCAYDAVGIACIYYKGYYFWVQEFGKVSSPDTTATTAVNGTKTMTVDIESADVYESRANLTELNGWDAVLKKGVTDYLPQVGLEVKMFDTVGKNGYAEVVAVPTWTSSNTGVATVNSNAGTITGVSTGSSSVIMKESLTNTTKSKTVTVTDPNAVTGVSLNKTTLALNTGASSTLTASVTPSTASNKNVTWSSSNTAVATVSSSGVVKGVKAGTATITAKTVNGGKTATCKVTVSDIAVTGVSLNRSSGAVNIGKTLKLSATVTPSNATNKNVTWSSSNTAVATVSSTGVVTGVKSGSATITVRTASGSKSASCKVDVGYYYIKNGEVDTSYTGLADVSGWKYFKNGVFDTSYTGMAKAESGIMYYVKNGVLDKSFTGFAKDTSGIWYHVKKGTHNTGYTGFTKAADGVFYYFTGGKQATNITGIVESSSGGRYYVTKGKYNTSFTGVAKFINDNKWYYVRKGVYTTWTGLAKAASGKWYYVKDGSYDTSYTGMTQAESGKWYYVTRGVYDTSFTGMAKAPSGKWYYINKGNYDKTYTGIARTASGGLYYITNGSYDQKFSGTAEFEGVTYTVNKGVVVGEAV